MIRRIAKLPVDERGYPVPFFVAWINGKPEFRIADSDKMKAAFIRKLCWVCGEPLRGEKTFAIGPMCVVNRVSSEPPSHYECAEWSVKACPFLNRPNMKRRTEEAFEPLREASTTPGVMIERNPGASCLWTTLSYERFDDGMGKGGKLVRVGPLIRLSWWAEGRQAKRSEVVESMETGLPILLESCRGIAEQEQEVHRCYEEALKLLPAEVLEPAT